MMFHEALAAALDASGATHPQWARRLGVDEDSLSHWISGWNTPSPQALHQVMQMLRDNPRCVAKRAALEQVLDQPASDVTGHDQRMHPTVGNYMRRPLREQVIATLMSLSTSEQEQVLRELLVTLGARRTSSG